MDFGGFDTFLSSTSPSNNKQECYGFGFLKQERAVNEDEFRDFKMAKTSSSSSSYCGEAMLRFPVQRSNGSEGHHQQMLSFSSQPVTLPYYHHTSSAFGRNTGYGKMLQGVGGGFTASQWMELEHQALIYKYITANVPIPSYLLNPITKAFQSAGFSALTSNALGWGGFQLGLSNSDPEPGRCRRTDGKKWRCSRDAVADQKYCERHMNRGRHRSRKPVEGQSGHSASATTTTNGKLNASSAPVVPSGGVSDTLALSPHFHPTATNHLSPIPTIQRSLLDKEDVNGAYQHATALSMTCPKFGFKDRQNAFQESSFGLVCSDSLLNPLNRSSSLINYNASNNNKSQHPLRHFMETQLSISIPMATSDFMSSTSSPTNENLTASPPTLSQELEMGLGVGAISVDRQQRQTNWVPISTGGPLGEVLHTTGECKSTKPLNLMDSWNNSPRLATSPTGVLQRGAFASLSNSSAASSPRAETSGAINPGLMNPSLPAL